MIIPSIDLMNGKAVQLRQGREKILERDHPLDLAREFNLYSEIAVIDLDAAMGQGSNTDLIREICFQADCRVGGGIRSIEKAKEYLSYGAHKIILGSVVFENDMVNHKFLRQLSSEIGTGPVIIAIDAYQNQIVTKGWTHQTNLNLFDVIAEL
ncbi:1-(5-phosphoribosyl)-5-[(5-phosphoribosylamino)methylideneamino] imidazole-4-carboxamide isomerase, partial [candidate division KSB1 bacterium]|nr:1-(5-phosphoribosyl)-5-[(5-phosphoribosylamino)methylideneamino] imidazole-4-carboxamide isomerase [candidate division KSB1 bacterium]